MGEPIEFGLVMPGRRHIARFEKSGGTRTLVYFDQAPTSFLSTPSRYKAVLDAHEPLFGSRRRPDVTVVHERKGRPPTVVFVEVKDTADAAYTADSVYKAFGYIHDFSELWVQQAANPKVILLFPENVKLRSNVNPASTDVALVSSLDRSGLASCLSSRLLS